MARSKPKPVSAVTVVLAVLILVVLLSVLFPAWSGNDRNGPGNLCLSNVKQLAVGRLMYADDQDGRLPEAAVWMDAIDPYVKNKGIDHCPSMEGKPDAYGYATDFALSRVELEAIPRPEKTIDVFESVLTARNATSGLYGFPDPPRHGKANSVAFSDGHVRRLTPGQFAEAAAESKGDK